MAFTVHDMIYALRKMYPDLEIITWEKAEWGKLIVNTKVIFKYDPDFMTQQLIRLGRDGFEQTVKIWAEYIETRYIKRLNRFDKKQVNGRPGLNLTESQIKYAIANSRSNSQAARFLNVHLITYKKYADMYNLYEMHKNFHGRGIHKGGRGKKVPFEDIYANKHPNLNLQFLKERLIFDMVFEEKCSICGYHEERVYDGKVAILLDFVDGNKKNMAKENMRLICYNCAFNIRGRISKKLMKKLIEENENVIILDDKQKQTEIYNKFNEPILENKSEMPLNDDNKIPIVQTNSNIIEDIWKKFNP
jgi:hypothetical protein